ncbi:MAG: hypothetical protein ACOX8B_08145 [Lachnospiraceae bacterium]|jgi:hypothetical protein
MINFEEELAKFRPSLEVDQTEKAIMNDKMTDLTDILQEILEEKNSRPSGTGSGQVQRRGV